MRIGIDARCLEWPHGGVASYLKHVLELWGNKGIDHEITLYFQNSVPDVPCLRFPQYRKKVIGGASFLKKRRIVAEQLLLPRLLGKDCIDIFFATWYSAPLLMKIPAIIGAWDISYSTHPSHYTLSEKISLGFFSRWSCVRAKGVVTCSDFDASQIEKFYAIPPEKILTVHLAADPKFTIADDPGEGRRRLEKYRLPEKYIFSVGAIHNRRHVDVLIEAFKKIKHDFPDVGLVVAGRNRTHPRIDIDALMAPLVQSGRGSRIEWVPEEDLVSFYQNAKLFVSTSDVDGETLLLKEAMQCGTPVMTSELLRDTIGGHGFVVDDPTSVEATSHCLRTALSSEESRDAYVRAGLAWNRQFSWEKVAEESLSFILQRALASN